MTDDFKLSYSEKLKDPKWQEKRQRIIELACSRCEDCGRQGGSWSFEVHHTVYIPLLDPWEYDDCFLMCLCRKLCHLKRQKIEVAIHANIAKLLRVVPVETLEKLAWVLVENVVREERLNG